MTAVVGVHAVQNLPDGQITFARQIAVQPLQLKVFCFPFYPNHLCVFRAVPSRTRGRFAIVTSSLGADAVDAATFAKDELHVARGRQSRVVLTPRWLVSSLSEARAACGRRWQQSYGLCAGESLEEAVKTIAQGRPGASAEPVLVTTVVLSTLCTRDPRVQRAPGARFPALSFLVGRNEFCRTRAHGVAEKAELCRIVLLFSSSFRGALSRERESSIPCDSLRCRIENIAALWIPACAKKARRRNDDLEAARGVFQLQRSLRPT